MQLSNWNFLTEDCKGNDNYDYDNHDDDNDNYTYIYTFIHIRRAHQAKRSFGLFNSLSSFDCHSTCDFFLFKILCKSFFAEPGLDHLSTSLTFCSLSSIALQFCGFDALAPSFLLSPGQAASQSPGLFVRNKKNKNKIKKQTTFSSASETNKTKQGKPSFERCSDTLLLVHSSARALSVHLSPFATYRCRYRYARLFLSLVDPRPCHSSRLHTACSPNVDPWSLLPDSIFVIP